MNTTTQTLPMLRQPTWPEGNAPDRITGVQGGFVDGAGIRHAIPTPYLFAGRQIDAAPGDDGVWYWRVS